MFNKRNGLRIIMVVYSLMCTVMGVCLYTTPGVDMIMACSVLAVPLCGYLALLTVYCDDFISTENT